MWRNDSSIDPCQKVKIKGQHHGRHFGLYLRLISRAICMVFSWRVTYLTVTLCIHLCSHLRSLACTHCSSNSSYLETPLNWGFIQRSEMSGQSPHLHLCIKYYFILQTMQRNWQKRVVWIDLADVILSTIDFRYLCPIASALAIFQYWLCLLFQ